MATKGTQRKKSTQRKLTAILSADVAGYSSLMGDDEEATIETLTAYRKVFTSEIKKHRGRVVDAKGDAILAEFASVVDAVSSAVEIQRELAKKNTDLSDDRRMDFRIGINLGDVVVKDDAIYGDGVNVAARLEALAEPGGVCISRPVHDQVRAKLDLEYEYLGEQEVKNIAEPVRAYSVNLTQSEGGKQVERPEPVSAASLLPGGISLELPDRPSIAVLPFVNMSGDPEQEYFSDGLTEDIITDLSKLRRLFVIASNSVFAYKGKPTDVRRVGEELGVKFVLEGSVRKAGDRVRITAQLVEATTGDHLWAERYDRELKDIFTLQDEITRSIAIELEVKLVEGEQARVWRKTVTNPEAYDLYLRGRDLYNNTFDRQGSVRACKFYEQAIALDPDFAAAFVALAGVLLYSARLGWKEPFEDTLEHCRELANNALALDDTLADAHVVIGHYHLLKKQHDLAIAALEEAIAIQPGSADALFHLARIQVYAGKPSLAVESIRKAKRLTPIHPLPFLRPLAHAFFLLEQYEEALAILGEVQSATPDSLTPNIFLAAIYAALEDIEKAESFARQIRRIEPDFKLGNWAPRALPYKEPADLERIMGLLRKAGLPN